MHSLKMGTVAGFNVFPLSDGRWVWEAWRNGNNASGIASTNAQASAEAQAAVDRFGGLRV